eukprot:2063758-Rhodomonas_salina.1
MMMNNWKEHEIAPAKDGLCFVRTWESVRQELTLLYAFVQRFVSLENINQVFVFNVCKVHGVRASELPKPTDIYIYRQVGRASSKRVASNPSPKPTANQSRHEAREIRSYGKIPYGSSVIHRKIKAMRVPCGSRAIGYAGGYPMVEARPRFSVRSSPSTDTAMPYLSTALQRDILDLSSAYLM